MSAAHPLLLCVLLAALALAAALPTAPQKHAAAPAKKNHHFHMPQMHMPQMHMPHMHMPHLSPKTKAELEKVKNCVKAQLVKLPAGVGHVMSNCVSSIATGPGGFGVCVAGKGVMSAARATSQIAACVG